MQQIVLKVVMLKLERVHSFMETNCRHMFDELTSSWARAILTAIYRPFNLPYDLIKQWKGVWSTNMCACYIEHYNTYI